MRAYVGDDDALLFRVFCDVRAQELSAACANGVVLTELLQLQHRAQLAYYRRVYPEAARVILLSEQTPAGYALVDYAQAAVTLVDLALLAAYRGQGLGGALLGTLQRDAAARGLPVRLRVRPNNPALRLYQRMGFTIVAHAECDLSMEWRAMD